jgi:hypothetical protein
MKLSDKALVITEEQALFFRARRGFLAGNGAKTPAQCARNMLGLQSQQLAPGLLALNQRLAARPTAKELENHLFGSGRDLVRTWGQRDTIHIYDSQTNWALITSARAQWSSGGRRGGMPSPKSVPNALELALNKGMVVKKDFLPLIDQQHLADLDPRIGDDAAKANFACGRLVWLLSLDGYLCQGKKQGSVQTYPTRQQWFPALKWPDPTPDPLTSCVALTRRYLSVNAPAAAQDLAHYFGAKVSVARRWLGVLDAGGELVRMECGGRKDLVALADDVDELQIKPGRSVKKWPLRLLPLWDTLLMSHRDKSWTMPDAQERSLVWRKAAHVSSVVLARGRVVAVWKMKKKGKHLDFDLQPLGSWDQATHLDDFRLESQAVARHLELQPGVMP